LRHEFAEHGGTACADVTEYLALLIRPHAAPAVEEFLSVLSEDIGDFQPMFTPGCGCSLREPSIGLNCNASKGLRAACQRFHEKVTSGGADIAVSQQNWNGAADRCPRPAGG
jgi:hypothetical protein